MGVMFGKVRKSFHGKLVINFTHIKLNPLMVDRFCAVEPPLFIVLKKISQEVLHLERELLSIFWIGVVYLSDSDLPHNISIIFSFEWWFSPKHHV